MLHQGSFEVLVDPLEADKKAFMTTGYPFDVPVGECGVASYGALVSEMLGIDREIMRLFVHSSLFMDIWQHCFRSF